MAESIASLRRVSMTGSITWNSKKQGVDQADFVCIDILNFYLDLRYDIRKNTNTKKTGSLILTLQLSSSSLREQ